MTTGSIYRRKVVLLICTLFLFGIVVHAGDQELSKTKRKTQPELEATDAQIRDLLTSAQSKIELGAYEETISLVSAAYDLSRRTKFVADMALTSYSMGYVHFVQGRWAEASRHYREALQLAKDSSNLVLQAEILVSLAGLSEVSGNSTDARNLLKQALEVALESKSLYAQARVLGELGRTELALGNKQQARVLIQRALEIDELNDYHFRAMHLIYMAQVLFVEPQPEIEAATKHLESAERIALETKSYLALVMAACYRAKGYVALGKPELAIELLTGLQEGRVPRADNSEAFRQRLKTSLSLLLWQSILLSTLGEAYVGAKDMQRGQVAYRELYSFAKSVGFVDVEAGAADELGRTFQATGDTKQAIEFFKIAVDRWRAQKNDKQLLRSLWPLCDLLMSTQQFDQGMPFWNELESLGQSQKNLMAQFVAHSSLGMAHYKTKRFEQALSSFTKADAILPVLQTDKNFDQKTVNSIAVQFYVGLSAFHRELNRPIAELIALEKALVAAEDGGDSTAKDALFPAIKELLSLIKVDELADQYFTEKDYQLALTVYELIDACAEFEARRSGNYELWVKTPRKSFARIVEIVYRLASDEQGAKALYQNLAHMGVLAGIAQKWGNHALLLHYVRQKKFDDAVEVGAIALGLTNLDKEKPFVGDVAILCHHAMAVYFRGGDKDVRELMNKCLDFAGKVTAEDPNLIQLARRLQVYVLGLQRPSEAEQSAMLVASGTPNDPLARLELGNIFARQGKHDEAIREWSAALKLYEDRGDKEGLARAHSSIGTTLRWNKAPDVRERAITHCEKALKLFQELRLASDVFRTHIDLADLATAAGRRSNAFEHLRAAESIANSAKDDELKARLSSAFGEAYAETDANRSLDNYRLAAEIYNRLGRKTDEAEQLRLAGTQLKKSRLLNEAVIEYIKAKRIADETDSWTARVFTRQSLGNGYEALGEIDKAIPQFLEAKQIAEENGRKLQILSVSYDLAWAYTKVAEWGAALNAANNTLTLARELGDKYWEFESLSTLANIYGDRRSSVRNLPKALELCDQAIAIAKEQPDNDVGRVSDLLVEIYWQLGRYDDAIRLAGEAMAYYEKEKDEDGYLNVLLALAETQRRKGDFKSAAEHLKKAEPRVRKLSDTFITGRSYYTQAGLANALGQYQTAVDLYRRALTRLAELGSKVEKSAQKALAESYSFVYDELIDALHSLWLQRNDAKGRTFGAQALEAAELVKARDFSASWGRVFARELRRQLPADLQERERSVLARVDNLSAEIQKLTEQNQRETTQLGKDLTEARRELDVLISELRISFPSYASVQFPESIRTSTLPLRAAEALFVVRITDTATFVWIVRRIENQPEVVVFDKIEKPRSWFDERITKIRDGMNREDLETTSGTAFQELSNAILTKEIAVAILSAESLIVVPDGSLFLIPFEMLTSVARTLPSMTHLPTKYYPSVTALTISRSRNRERSWQSAFLGFGNPITSTEPGTRGTAKPQNRAPMFSAKALRTRGFSFEELPGTAEELRGIAQLFAQEDAQVRLGNEATKTRLVRTELEGVRFLHLATHGLLPVDSGLVEPALLFSSTSEDLGDKLLTMSEILQLRTNAEMVVLSACNTGSGNVSKAEGVANLGRAFMLSGSGSAVISLWRVADESTSKLMKEFYRNLLQGKPKDVALAAARAALIQQGYKSPFFWAAFVLTGE